MFKDLNYYCDLNGRGLFWSILNYLFSVRNLYSSKSFVTRSPWFNSKNACCWSHETDNNCRAPSAPLVQKSTSSLLSGPCPRCNRPAQKGMRRTSNLLILLNKGAHGFELKSNQKLTICFLGVLNPMRFGLYNCFVYILVLPFGFENMGPKKAQNDEFG